MKIYIFGIGQYFQNREKQFWEISSDDEIIGFLDNRADQVNIYDGIPVYPPSVILDKQFDCIILMSIHCNEIRKQLKKLGISETKIVFWEQYRAEKMRGRLILQFNRMPKKSKSVLVVSTDLSFNGGTIAALNAVIVLIRRGYNVCLAAPSCDNKLYQEVKINKINLIICA